ncbi:hypothetical protein E3Q23_01256 [Wallemia mellicola]|uniref:WD40 repeat-like protein n=1 Tax=Wallemia mellicola TaxID=1708541 RepID=A0A4T0U9C8_9BASI|nr:hypothetical protein E3Q24_01475 [Wallemia mellicola]TIB77537.1 hypothetical protein E3Q23_01256 [Wallemia mellicola]TIB86872.1 WD40 repeat-like protein [Wallemia mellicola]TIB89818.1 WD40 repeat-like protein [Wallemia mellicola]TIC06199.1 WD40 repeat-like protein [Wallemia mellicola]
MASTLSYNAPFPVAAMAWANTSGPQQYLQSPNVLQRPTPVAHSPESSFRLAIGSFVEDYSNQIQVIGLNSGLPLTDPDVPPIGYDGSDFNVLASTHHGYPATKIAWEPSTSSPHSPLKRSKSELIASSSDVLKIWEYNQESNLEANSGFIHTKNGTNTPGSLNLISQLTPKTPGTAAPLTSFSWNETIPSRIVTCSIDTTCTVWDLDTRTAITQLIAHDREVYDVQWLPRSSDIFVSVGADGSLRAFDLRSLEHSTILYETTPPTSSSDKKRSNSPLLRLEFNPHDSNYLATFKHGSGEINILDMRSPGAPVTNIKGHNGNISSISWKSDGSLLATGSDDRTVQVWDINKSKRSNNSSSKANVVTESIANHKSAYQVHSIEWSKRKNSNWIAMASNYQIKLLKL